jgi:hypothetical protein
MGWGGGNRSNPSAKSSSGDVPSNAIRPHPAVHRAKSGMKRAGDSVGEGLSSRRGPASRRYRRDFHRQDIVPFDGKALPAQASLDETH